MIVSSFSVPFLFLSLFLSFVVCQDAIAYMKGTENDETIIGTVEFLEDVSGEVEIRVNITGITNNVNETIGMHIHQFGDISSPDGSSAGSHYVGNGNSTHGCSDNSTRHAGDLGNFEVNSQIIYETRLDSVIKLSGKHSIIGRGVVLHSNTDDCTGASGNAGIRLAYGVIGISSPAIDSEGDDSVESATCILTGTAGNNVSGAVKLTKNGDSLSISASIMGISGEHGFHIHQLGDISDADGSAVGSHYNPHNATHGYPENEIHHVGDLGNITDQGTNEIYTFEGNFDINLTGSTGVIGRAMIIHSGADDGSDPSGNAGSRIARCVIGVSNDPIPLPTEEPVTDEVPTDPEPSNYINSKFAFSIFALSLLFSIFV